MVVYSEVSVDFVQQKFIKINAKAGDSASRYLRITCYNDGVLTPLNSDEVDVYIRYKKPDDLGVFKKGIVTNTGKIEVELIPQMLTCYGLAYADVLVISKGGAVENRDGHIHIEAASILTSMLFCVNVQEEALTDAEMLSDEDYSDLIRIIEMAYINIGYIDGFVIRAEDAATSAESSKKAAASSATAAHTSETNAHISEVNAHTSETNAHTSEVNAHTSETNADNYRKRSEAWAVGQVDGVDVPSTDETYENNAKHWADYAEDMYNGTVEFEGHAEAWAKGTIEGVPVSSTDPAYHNNSKYWADLARVQVEPFIHGAEIDYTLYASEWFSSSYSLEEDFPYEDYYMWIQPAADATLAQMKAFGNAILSSEDNQNILVADGIVPTIDIPCKLYLIAKMTP